MDDANVNLQVDASLLQATCNPTLQLNHTATRGLYI